MGDDSKERINLGEVIDAVTEEMFKERVKEVHLKVKYVIQGVNEARLKISSLEHDLKKAQERYEKGLNKLDQIRKGNWSLLEDNKQQPKETENE